MIQLNELTARAYKCACEHGFHDEEHHDSHWLALIMSEVGEALNADRKGKHAKSEEFIRWQTTLRNPSNDRFYIADFDYFIKDTVEDELADIVIRILDFAGLRDYDCSKYFETLCDITFVLPEKDQLSFFCYTLFTMLANTQDDIEDVLRYSLFFISFYCKKKDIDLYTYIVWKMKYNELRPMLNGKKY